MQTDTETALKASELRIGNLVCYNSMKHPRINELGELSFSTINTISRSFSSYNIIVNRKESREWFFDIKDIKPIPLTPEILEKAGFENGYKEIDNQLIQVHLESKQVSVSGQDACTNGHAFWIENISHVHQLQNLYHSLTGKELQINL